MNYTCKYGLMHDKPISNGKPSSNNGWLYLSFWNELGMLDGKFDRWKRVKHTFSLCANKLERNYISINRLPNKIKPPISADEILGMYTLNLISYTDLKNNHFVFKGKGKPLSSKVIEDFVKGIFKLILHVNLNLFMSKKKKLKLRNIHWEKNIEEMHQLSFRLTPAHIFLVKKIAHVTPHREEKELFNFYYNNLVKNDSNSTSVLSQKNLMWLLLHKAGYKRKAKKLKPWITFTNYFGTNHPIALQMRLKYGKKA